MAEQKSPTEKVCENEDDSGTIMRSSIEVVEPVRKNNNSQPVQQTQSQKPTSLSVSSKDLSVKQCSPAIPTQENQHEVLSLPSNNEDAMLILNKLIQQKKLTIDDVNSVVKKEKKSVSNNDNTKKNEKKRKKLEKKQLKVKVEYMTRHIAFRFHYDGSTYNGLAENRNCSTDNSVEKVLFAALEKTCLVDGAVEICSMDDVRNRNDNGSEITIETESKEGNFFGKMETEVGNTRDKCNYSRSGRTDKGVSAFGQVIALRVRSAFPAGTMIPTFENESTKADGKNRKPMEESDMPQNSLKEVQCWVPQPPTPPSTKRRKRNKIKKKDSNENRPLIERSIREKNYCQLLNNVLPPAVRMLGWCPVSNDFSARFSTSSRTYRYFFIKRDLDLDAMQEALNTMVGKHDFRNLCKMNCEEVDNFVRVVNYAKIIETETAPISNLETNGDNHGDSEMERKYESSEYRRQCYFEIQGQAFLWHQIRCIASILFMVGKGHESPSVVKELLDIEANPGKPHYQFAPELPLVLHKCEYKNLTFGHTVQNLWKVSCDLESKWEELALSAERIRDGIDSLGTDALVSSTDVIDYITSLAELRKKKMSRSNSMYSKKDMMMSRVDLSALANDIGIQSHILWKDAKVLIEKYGGGKPEVGGPKVQLHNPLMQRARSTTYEEKIKSIMRTETEKSDGPPSKRRRQVYEDNIKKKKLSKEEDYLFYQKMLNEGGNGL